MEAECGIPETVSCRYNPGGVFEVCNGIMDNPGDAKYGMTPEQIVEAFKILKAKGVKNFGIHAFLASNTVTNEYYPMLARTILNLQLNLKKKQEQTLSLLTFQVVLVSLTDLIRNQMTLWQLVKV